MAAGEFWRPSLLAELERADVVVLLVSRAFRASEWCQTEMNRALERARAGEARVVPVLVSPCTLEPPLSELAATPIDEAGRMTPISAWTDAEAAWTAVERALRDVLDRLPRLEAPVASGPRAYLELGPDVEPAVSPRARACLQRAGWAVGPTPADASLLVGVYWNEAPAAARAPHPLAVDTLPPAVACFSRAPSDLAALDELMAKARLLERRDALPDDRRLDFDSLDTLVDRLAAWLGRLETGRAPAPAPERWLERQSEYLSQLHDDHAQVVLSGLLSDKACQAVPVTDVWVPLAVRTERVGDDDRRQPVDVEADTVFSQPGDLLVEGDPGSGKTTFLMRAVAALVEAHQGSASAARAMGFDPADLPIPALVPLRELRAPERGQAAFAPLREHLLELFQPYGGDEYWLEAALTDGRLLLLLDGLDEVVRATARAGVARAAVAFRRRYPACRYVMTTRPSGLTRPVEKHVSKLPRAVLQPLDDARIRAFVRAWYRALVKSRATADAKATALCDRISASDALGQLATVPVTLTAIAVVHQTIGRLPERRAELFEHCVQALCHRLDDVKGLDPQRDGDDDSDDPPGGRLSARQRVKLLQRVAWEIQSQGEDAVSIQQGPLATLVATQLDTAEPLVVLDHLAQRSGLLIPHGSKAYRFRHLQFQAFLAARHACDVATDPVEALAPHLHDPWWREVIVLAPAFKVSRSDTEGLALLRGLHAEAGRRTPGPRRVAALASVARALVDLRHCEVKGLEGVFEELSSSFVAGIYEEGVAGGTRDQAALGDALGWFGDPRLVEHDPWVEVPAGEFFRGDERNGAYLDERPSGRVRLRAYRVARWPITRGEYARFVDAGGYAHDGWWDAEAPAEVREPHATVLDAEWRPPNHPVAYVSWWEARAYARWLTAHAEWLRDGEVVRLPTEAEWERAARGSVDDPEPRRRYPWGDEYEPWRSNGWDAGHGRTTAVGIFHGGHGPGDVWDQAGNVLEWCLDRTDALPPYPSASAEDPIGREGRHRVVRGGGFVYGARSLRVSFRRDWAPADRDVVLGFRLVAAPRLDA